MTSVYVGPVPVQPFVSVKFLRSDYNGVMKSAMISELRDSLSKYLARVRKGETVIVYDRDTPIARIEPIAPADGGVPDWVRDAERRGILSPPKVRRPARLPPPVKIDRRFSVLEALLEERRSGR
jgi:antitoxin (DNA-binding transcriptional repressor) of toxin-antitoxin stability system